ncbi:hypothetical protein QR685DRAFT_573086 [Neurospora intermedia]|uniref:Uncharacterized protein n=1 Tax=Neurospora intermedia TaxID=5142 RepID=A0ABR3D7X5_NEUIN
MLATSAITLLPAASPIPPALSTATATSALPGNHHEAALKPRQTDFWPADYWPEKFPPDRWPGRGWGAKSRPCHANQFYSCAGPYMHGDQTCQNSNGVNTWGMTAGWGCFCEHAKKFFKCMSQAEDDDPNCWNDGYGGDNWQLNWYQNWCGDTPPPSVMAEMSQPRAVDVSFTKPDVVYADSSEDHALLTRVNDPIYTGSGSLLSGECTSTDFTLVGANDGYTMYYAGFQGCNDDRPQCCPWPVAADSATNSFSATVNVEVEPEIEIEHKRGDNYPQPARGYSAKLKNCPDDYYSVSGGCCPAGYFFFTSAIGGQTPCWSPLGSTASIPPITHVAAAYTSRATNVSVTGSDGDGGNDDPNDIDSLPTSAVNNVIFSRHYPVDNPKALSIGSYIGIALGISIATSTALAAIIWFWLRWRKRKIARLRRAAQLADNDNYPGIWDGHHGSDEQLFQFPPQELDTFGQNGKPTALDQVAAAGAKNGGDAAQQAQYLRQLQQSFGFHNVGTRGHSNGINSDFTPGLPLSVHIPPRVSSAAAAAGLSTLPPISSTRSKLPPINQDGNPCGAHAVGSGDIDSKGGKPEGATKEEALQYAGVGSGAAGSSSFLHVDQRQRRSHPTELEGNSVAVPDGHGSGFGLEVEGDHEPPPEYREF